MDDRGLSVAKLVACCSCPHCGAGLGYFRYWIKVKPSAEWACTQCGARQKLDSTRHKRLELIGLAAMAAGVFLATFGQLWWCTLFIAVLLAQPFFEDVELVQVAGQSKHVGRG
jgi:uncharacterized protein (DUF983 family)